MSISYSAKSPAVPIIPRRGFRKTVHPRLDPLNTFNHQLRGRWMLGDVTAGIAADISHYSNNGTYNGTIGLAASDRGGHASSFDGSSAYVDCGDPPSLQLAAQPIAIGCRIYVSSFPTSGNLMALVVKKYDGTNISYYLDIFNNSGTQQMRCGTFQQPASSNQTVWNISFGTGSWHSIYAGWDGVSWLIWSDGVLVSNTVDAQGPRSDSGRLTIGAHDLTGTVSRFFNGRIESVLLRQVRPVTPDANRYLAEPYVGVIEPGPRWRDAAVAGGFTAVNRRTLGPRVGSRSFY